MMTSSQVVAIRKRTKETAEHYSVSKMTIYRWSKQSGFPKPLKRGSVVLYDIAAIDRWLECECA